MEKLLNTVKLKDTADSQGLSQTAIAKALGLTKASVSKWFTGKSLPRPSELLKLGRLLGLQYDELVQRTIPREEPIVAFRRRGSCKTTDKHIAHAKDMGRFLKPLVEYLDVDEFIGPPSLKSPSCEYKYLQNLAARIRRDLNVAEHDPVDFGDLIGMFHEHQAVIIPTMWGKKTRHENAIHIHLTESKTTWIYLNLDVEIHDFKFWMAHELGHVLTIDLLREQDIDTAEDFADAFAVALLFPEQIAEQALIDYNKCRTDTQRLKTLGKWAEAQVISPNSVYKELQNFTSAHSLDFQLLPQKELHAFISTFNKSYETLSEALFDGNLPSANHFMRVAQEKFGTKVYSALGNYVADKSPSPGAIATILGVNPMDAKTYLKALEG